MRFEGTFIVAAPRAVVWEKIKDPALIAACIPGCEAVEALSPTSYRTRVVIVVGPIKASFTLVVEVTGEEWPDRIRSTTHGEEGTRASIVRADNLVTLAERVDGGTEVSYASDVSVTGRLGKFGLGVMKKKAEALGEQFAEAFCNRVERIVAGAAP